ncbi:MAG: Sec-independent protein translocase protein TatB [Gammaproteobacteria bacterium]
MFDMGFTEMMLIGIVALVVIGPERLPGVARTAGKYFARLRNFMMDVRADVESELKADELREMFEAQQKELQSLKDVVSDAGKDIGLSDIKNEMSDIASSIEDEKPTTNPEPEVKKKSVKRAKPLAKVTAKSNSRAKPAAKPKIARKPKPRTISKVKTMPKASAKAKAASVSKPPKPTAVKRARVKAK